MRPDLAQIVTVAGQAAQSLLEIVFDAIAQRNLTTEQALDRLHATLHAALTEADGFDVALTRNISAADAAASAAKAQL